MESRSDDVELVSVVDKAFGSHSAALSQPLSAMARAIPTRNCLLVRIAGRFGKSGSNISRPANRSPRSAISAVHQEQRIGFFYPMAEFLARVGLAIRWPQAKRGDSHRGVANLSVAAKSQAFEMFEIDVRIDERSRASKSPHGDG